MTRTQQAEQVIGRIRNDGGIDRRFRMSRMARTRLDEWPQQALPVHPYDPDGLRLLGAVLSQVLLVGGLLAGALLVTLGYAEYTPLPLGCIGLGMIGLGLLILTEKRP